ncbi:KR domain-containing protein [Streptomyces sp. NPDC048665]|uniref:KR domain-containing protein n=1 Tax=Streptomyces sp. NPDC048665 TaxID=3155490 RepID=UPI00343FAE38
MSIAAVRGLFRTAAYEHPELRATVLEVAEEGMPYTAVVGELLDESQPPAEIALLPEGRHVAQVLNGPGSVGTGTAASATPPVPPGAAYLVTGGLGGLGLLTVEWLARRGAGRIVISGRSAPMTAGLPAASRR